MSQRNKSPFGHRQVGSDGAVLHTSVATIAALAAIDVNDLAHGDEAMLESDQSNWYWHATSTLTADSILIAGAAAAGRWLRKPGLVDLALPIGFATADNATLLTIPTGARLAGQRTYLEVTTAWAGGSSSAIGLDSDLTGYSTAGDLAGGAAGDLEAGLTVGVRPGVIGAKMDADTEHHDLLLLPTNVVRFQRITSVFTSGAGFYHLCGHLLRNAGA